MARTKGRLRHALSRRRTPKQTSPLCAMSNGSVRPFLYFLLAQRLTLKRAAPLLILMRSVSCAVVKPARSETYHRHHMIMRPPLGTASQSDPPGAVHSTTNDKAIHRHRPNLPHSRHGFYAVPQPPIDAPARPCQRLVLGAHQPTPLRKRRGVARPSPRGGWHPRGPPSPP